ncbi:MAG: MOSC domain-containing protein [Pseudomonadota bacterium]
MQGTVRRLFHYPVKGLSPQPMESVLLAPGRGFPFDRVFAFARPGSGYDPSAFRPLPKTRFYMLARDAALAALDTSFDPSTCRLRIASEGGVLFDGSIDTADGAEAAREALAGFLGLEPDEVPLLAAAPDDARFTDVSVRSAEMMQAVSLINLASVRDLGERIGAEIDPLRFRANIYVDGWPAWSELDLEDRPISIGPTRFHGVLRTRRCPATEVNPETATRDLDIPRLLSEHLGHSDMGLYAEVTSGGEIAVGQDVLA